MITIPPLTEEPLKTDEELKQEEKMQKEPEKQDHKSEVLSDDLKEKMAEHEGVKSGPYVDSNGYLTIGVGNNVNKLNNFLALNLTNTKTGEKLTDSEKRDMHSQMLSEMSNKTFNAEKYSYVQIPRNEMYEKFDAQLNQSYKELERKFSDFNTLPVPVKQALLDMQFNIGDAGFQRTSNVIGGRTYTGWPKLFDAIKNQDWATAARESNRKDVQSSRNIWTREKFMLGYNE